MPGVSRFQLKIIEISDQKVESLFSHNPTSTLVPWQLFERSMYVLQTRHFSGDLNQSAAQPLRYHETGRSAKLIRRIYLRAMLYRLFFGRSSVRMPGQLVKLSGIKRMTS